MKKLTMTLFSLFLAAKLLLGADYYVDTKGSDSNLGTQGSPFLTIQHAINTIAPGDYIYVRGGTYSYSVEVSILSTNDGTSSGIKHLWAYPGEAPVLDFSTQSYGSTSSVSNPRGLSVKGDYWHVKGLTVRYAADNGIFVSGSNNVVESCITHGNKDTGLQIARLSSSTVASDWPKNNLILKCESYDNYDSPPNGGENADGFACKLTTGTGNKFIDCYAHNNIDDGWDLYTKTETGAIGAVVIDRCIAAYNGKLTNGTSSSSGDRNGFKLGGEDIAVAHIVTRCVSFQNGKNGFTWNSNPGQIRISNCLSWNNPDANYKFDSPSAAIFTNNLSVWFSASGVNDKYKTGTDVSNTNCWWNNSASYNGKGLSCTAADFANTLYNSTVKRAADGTLDFSFYKLVSGSDLVNAGVIPGGTLPFDASYYIGNPDLGAYEGTGGSTVISVTGVSLTPTSSTITSANGTVQLNATVSPSNATNKNVSWKSSNTSVANVNTSGMVTGLSNGTATITVTTEDGSKTATSAITVNISTTTVPVTSVSVTPTSTSVEVGKTATLTATVSPSNATNKSVSWSSSNTSIASVSSSGVVTGVAQGSAVITVTTADGGKTASCTVTVIDAVVVTGIRIDDSATTSTGLCSFDGALKAYSGASNGYAINLSNSSGKGITWKAEVASEGTYTLTWRYVNGASSAATSAKLIINGTTVNSSLAFAKTADKSTFITTSATATFVKGVNQIRIETASSSEFADIDWIEISGSVIGAANCSAAIGSGGSSSTVAVTGVTVSSTSSTITTSNGTVQLFASVAPSNASNKNVSWSSSNTSVATVSSTGLVTAKANGSATITVTTADGNKTATSQVTVNVGSATVSVTGISVSPTSSTITSSNGTVQLTATVAPSNATNKNVSWSSSNTSIATVSSTGIVTGLSNGSSTITVTTADGNKTASYIITVNIGTTPVSTDMVGYATVEGGTTGGAGGSSITISTLAQLQSWVSSREGNTTPEVVYINTKISSSSSLVLTIKDGANISIYGVGSAGELQNIGLNIRDYKNVIVRNIKIHEVFYPNDALTLDACEHVWVDHCEFHSKIGSGIGVDTYDGLLDIKKGSRYITVSWCYLHDHMKCSLIGHTDNTGQQATDSQMRITYHHNWFSNTDGRNPSIRFGAIHMFNNYFDGIADYGLAARDGAHAKVENCHYNNVLLSMSTDKFPVSGLPNGYICQSGNLFTGSTGAPVISQTGCDFWSNLPYSYTLDPVANVASILKANCGIGKVSNLKSGAVISSENSIQAAQAKPSVSVYPNPFQGSATIKFKLTEASKVIIKINDLSGRQVDIVANGNYDAGENEIVYTNAALVPGVYVLTFEAGVNTSQMKIVVK